MRLFVLIENVKPDAPYYLICKALPRQVHPQPVSVLIADPIAIAATKVPPKPPNHQYFVEQSEISAPKRRKLYCCQITNIEKQIVNKVIGNW